MTSQYSERPSPVRPSPRRPRTDAPPARAEAPVDEPVYLCRRPAWGWLGSPFDHWWLRHADHEAGMGERLSTGWIADTELVDHHVYGHTPGYHCEPVGEVFPEHADLDTACVDRLLTPGRETGDYLPFVNDCHDAMLNIIEACDISDREDRE